MHLNWPTGENMETFYITVHIGGQYIRPAIQATGMTMAYEIACGMYGRDNVTNDASRYPWLMTN